MKPFLLNARVITKVCLLESHSLFSGRFNMNKHLSSLTAFVLMVLSSLIYAQESLYRPDLYTGRFVSPEAVPELKSWAPSDTAVRPEINRSYQGYNYPPRPAGAYAPGTPENRINAPIPYIFAPISPSGPFLLR